MSVFTLTVSASITMGIGAEMQSEPWKAPARASRVTNPFPADAKSIAAGMVVYRRECAACHGPKGLGDGSVGRILNPLPTNLTDPAVLAMSDGEWFWKTMRGRAPMPTYKDLISEEEVWNVINYIRTLAPSAPAGPAVSAPEFASPDEFRSSISKLLSVYFQTSNSVLEKDLASTAQQATALAGAIKETSESMSLDALDPKAKKAWASDMNAFLIAAAGLAQSDQTIEAVRARFAQTSRAAIALTAHFGHAESSPLQVFTSDYAVDGKPAAWLQATDSPKDPFTGKTAAKQSALKKLLGSHQ